MTLLMIDVQPDHALVVSDTFVDPPAFMTKVAVVPHLELVIAGTGLGNLLGAWSAMVNGLRCRDIDELAVFAEALLPQLWDAIHEGRDPQDNGVGCTTASIYHVGRTADRGYVAYAYRSREAFVHAEISPCFMVKPAGEDTPTPTPATAPETLQEIIALAEQIQADQRSLPADECLDIGGELVGIEMSEGGISVAKLHRFDSYDDDWAAIIEASSSA